MSTWDPPLSYITWSSSLGNLHLELLMWPSLRVTRRLTVVWEITTTFIAGNAIPIFSNKQFGFIKGRSTSLQLLQILDKWTELLKNGGQIDVIYTDLEKAFDKIPHKMLISKLSSHGLNKEIISWFEAFLNNSKQKVCIKGIFSDWVGTCMEWYPTGFLVGTNTVYYLY